MGIFASTLLIILGVAFVFGLLTGGAFAGGYAAGFVLLPALIVAGIVAFINRGKK